MTRDRETRRLPCCFLSALIPNTPTIMLLNTFFVASFREITDFENEGQVEKMLKQESNEREIQQIEYLTLLLLKGRTLFNLGKIQESLEVVDLTLQLLDDPNIFKTIANAAARSDQMQAVQHVALLVEALLQRSTILSYLGKRKETESLLQRIETLIFDSGFSEVFERSFAREDSL